MMHRDGRPGDYHSGKWNGLGGKLEPGESPLEAARREFAEESGIKLEERDFRPLGTLQFPNFKAHKHEDWQVTVFTADADAGAALTRSDEGSLHWVSAKELLSLPVWAGDRHFLPYVLDETPFIGTIWYQGQEVTRHWIRTLAS
jgi:8-oxo-dGTP diphosphatase